MKTGMFTCGHQRLPVEEAFRDAHELGLTVSNCGSGAPRFRPRFESGGLSKSKHSPAHTS